MPLNFGLFTRLFNAVSRGKRKASVFNFGPFNTLFETTHGEPVSDYLALLNLHNGLAAVRKLRAACAADSQVVPSNIRSMLGHVNWRVQLVAASAMAVEDITDCLDDLWAALDRPCWTSPQLAVTAALIDTSFLDKARIRLERRCELTIDTTLSLSPIERHVSMGPASGAGHSAKLFSALFALCEDLNAPWLAEFRAEDGVTAMLAADHDRGDDIALGWKADILSLKALTVPKA